MFPTMRQMDLGNHYIPKRYILYNRNIFLTTSINIYNGIIITFYVLNERLQQIIFPLPQGSSNENKPDTEFI